MNMLKYALAWPASDGTRGLRFTYTSLRSCRAHCGPAYRCRAGPRPHASAAPRRGPAATPRSAHCRACARARLLGRCRCWAALPHTSVHARAARQRSPLGRACACVCAVCGPCNRMVFPNSSKIGSVYSIKVFS